MKRKVPAWITLMLIATVSGLLLGVTNAVTTPAIERQSLAAADAGRIAVFPDADSFSALALGENATIDSCYEALKNGEVVGHVGTATVKGYGGDIEITIGLDSSAVITGINVGGDNFAESPGLGARTREATFTGQFVQKKAPVTLGKEIDSITGASISSGAVVSGVNRIVKYIENLGKDASETDLYHNALDDSFVELPGDGTIDAAYRSEDGRFVVFASAPGFHGDVYVVVLTDANGVIARLAIDETNFNETAGLGERVLEEEFLAQFIGLGGVIGVNPGGYGAGGTDATSAATGNATEWADNDATGEATPDATSAATGSATEWAAGDATGEATPDATSAATGDATEWADNDAAGEATPDATSAATGDAAEWADNGATGEATPDATSAATGDATEWADGDTASGATAAAGSDADATSSASIVIEKIEGADASIDGVSGATYSSTSVTKAVNAALAFVRRYLGAAE